MTYLPLLIPFAFIAAMVTWFYVFQTRIWVPEMKRREWYFIKRDWKDFLSRQRHRINNGLADGQRRHELWEHRNLVRRQVSQWFINGLIAQFPLHFAIFVILLFTALVTGAALYQGAAVEIISV
jgi:hypothetical protein